MGNLCGEFTSICSSGEPKTSAKKRNIKLHTNTENSETEPETNHQKPDIIV